jgi:hypothetical protein
MSNSNVHQSQSREPVVVSNKRSESILNLPFLAPLVGMGGAVLLENAQVNREMNAHQAVISQETIRAQVEIEKERLLTPDERKDRLQQVQHERQTKAAITATQQKRNILNWYSGGLLTWSDYYCSNWVFKSTRMSLQQKLIVQSQVDFPFEKTQELQQVFRSSNKIHCGSDRQHDLIQNFLSRLNSTTPKNTIE